MITAFAVLIGLMAPSSGQLLIQAQPSTVSVTVDGKAMPYKPGKPMAVAAGRRKVEVSQRGYQTQTRTVMVKAGGQTKLSFKLAKGGLPKAIAGKAPAKKPTLGRPTVRKPAAKRPATKKPAIKQPTSKQPAAKRPATKRPVAKRPTNKRPITKRPVTKKPGVAKKPATSRPVVAKKPRTGTKPTVTRKPMVRRKPTTTRPAVGGGGVNGAAPVAPAPRSRPSLKPWAVFSFVVGGLAVTGGVLAGMQANDKADEFNGSVDRREKLGLKDDAENWALGANVAYGIGATAIVVGGLLWAMDPGDGYAASISPLPEGGAMVGLGGTF